ncbi:MAG TPA: DUF3455 domain-containing protein [Chloroflexota bacterium]|jgi:hypothetical protein
MYFLQHDDMLDLAKYEQAELRRQAAQDLLADQAKAGSPRGTWRWPSVFGRLWSAVKARPDAVATAVVVAGLSLVLFASTSYAQPAPPPVPADIQVPAGNHLVRSGHAEGTQNYVCLPSAAGYGFSLFTPQATLSSSNGQQVITHYFSPNPFEDGTVRATWQDSLDSSTIWGKALRSSSDPAFVAPGAIGWVLLQQVGQQSGPNGGEALSATTYIQRVNTAGGAAPSTGCSSEDDIGNQAFVPYSADYLFYAKSASSQGMFDSPSMPPHT